VSELRIVDDKPEPESTSEPEPTPEVSRDEWVLQRSAGGVMPGTKAETTRTRRQIERTGLLLVEALGLVDLSIGHDTLDPIQNQAAGNIAAGFQHEARECLQDALDVIGGFPGPARRCHRGWTREGPRGFDGGLGGSAGVRSGVPSLTGVDLKQVSG